MKWAAVVALAATASSSACVHDAVHLSGRDVHRISPHGSGFHAYHDDDRVDVGPDTVVDATDTDGHHRELRLVELYAGCDAGSASPCPIDALPDIAIPYRHVSHTVKATAQTVAVLGVLGGLIGCTIECSSPYDYVSGGVLVLGGIVVLGGLYLIAQAVTHMD